MARIRLLAVDMDGTLLDSRSELTAANRQALDAAHQQGVAVALVTGRRFTFVAEIAATLPFECVIIASNGAVTRTTKGETLARQFLPQQTARAVLAEAGPFRRRALLLFDRDRAGQIVAESLEAHREPAEGYFARNRKYLAAVAPLEAALSEDPVQVMFRGPVAEMRGLAEHLWGARCAGAITVARTEYPPRDLTLVDVLDRGCTKGAALARFAGQRGIRREEIMAVGDNFNDSEMLAFAGLPVLMGNSSDEMKRNGWPVTGTNDENGVAAAIEKYVLAAQ